MKCVICTENRDQFGEVLLGKNCFAHFFNHLISLYNNYYDQCEKLWRKQNTFPRALGFYGTHQGTTFCQSKFINLFITSTFLVCCRGSSRHGDRRWCCRPGHWRHRQSRSRARQEMRKISGNACIFVGPTQLSKIDHSAGTQWPNV